MKTVRLFAVILIVAVHLSACAAGETGDTPVPYDEAYDCEPSYSYESYNNEVCNYTPPIIHVLNTNGMYIGETIHFTDQGGWRYTFNNIELGEIAIITYNGSTSKIELFHFMSDADILLSNLPYGWSRDDLMNLDDWLFSIYAFSNYNILFNSLAIATPASPSINAIKNLQTGELNTLDYFPTIILTNGLGASFVGSGRVILLDMQTGRPADIQLDFDYGNYANVNWHNFSGFMAYERFVFGLEYDMQTNQYFMFYAEGQVDSYRIDLSQHDGSQGRLAIFDETGRQINSMEIANLRSSRWNPHGGRTPSGRVHFYDGRLFFASSFFDDYEVDFEGGIYYRGSGEHRLPSAARVHLGAGRPLPLTITYTAENIYIYNEDGTLLQTLDGGFALSFYTFNDNGDAVMLFYQHTR